MFDQKVECSQYIDLAPEIRIPYASAVKKAGRQSNDAFDKTLAQNACANAALSPAPEKHAVRQDDRRFASALEAFEHVQ